MRLAKGVRRQRRVSLWRYWRMFWQDILSTRPDHLYRAKMTGFRTPFFRSFLINEPLLVRLVLNRRPADFPKSDGVARWFAPLLGQSVFVANGPTWERQRRIIDPSFEGGRVRDSFPAMLAAAAATADRLEQGEMDVEALSSHATADVIFRTLFSLPNDKDLASETYDAFCALQREQPIAIGAALIPWLPVRHKKPAREAAAQLRDLIGQLVERRPWELDAGNTTDDLATRIMTTRDPDTEVAFSTEQMVDQVAIFFLAWHESSAVLLGWALWCLAAAPDRGERWPRKWRH